MPRRRLLLPEDTDEDIKQAAALAAISGQTEAPPPRSLLTGAPNSCTYVVVDTADTEPAIRAGDLLRALIEIDRKLADGCGKIRFLENKNGLCFDIDATYMSDLEGVTDLNGFELSVCTQLPQLMAEQTRERLRPRRPRRPRRSRRPRPSWIRSPRRWTRLRWIPRP